MNISFPDKQKLTFQAPKLTFYFNKIKKLVLKYNNIYLKKKPRCTKIRKEIKYGMILGMILKYSLSCGLQLKLSASTAIWFMFIRLAMGLDLRTTEYFMLWIVS